MHEVQETCKSCGHALAVHTRDVRGAGAAEMDALSGREPHYDIRSDTFAGQSGCTLCACNVWEPRDPT
jgi:hypothetical protein